MDIHYTSLLKTRASREYRLFVGLSTELGLGPCIKTPIPNSHTFSPSQAKDKTKTLLFTPGAIKLAYFALKLVQFYICIGIEKQIPRLLFILEISATHGNYYVKMA